MVPFPPANSFHLLCCCGSGNNCCAGPGEHIVPKTMIVVVMGVKYKTHRFARTFSNFLQYLLCSPWVISVNNQHEFFEYDPGTVSWFALGFVPKIIKHSGSDLPDWLALPAYTKRN